MKKIEKAFSHLNLKLINDSNKKKKIKERYKPVKNEIIKRVSPYKVKSFSELVEKVALLQFFNRRYQLFFRGSSDQHLKYSYLKNKIELESYKKYIPFPNKVDTLYPSLFYLNGINCFTVFKDVLEKDFRDKILSYYQKEKSPGYREFKYFYEAVISIMQHYGVFKTHFLDITSSLQVACTFALYNEYEKESKEKNREKKKRVVYVIGLPYVTDIITYNPFEEIVTLKLDAFITPYAKRPVHQNAYLVSPYPYTELENPNRKKYFDFSRRLIGIFEVPDNNDNFWDGGYKMLSIDNADDSTSLLYPNKTDKFYKLSQEFIRVFKSKNKDYKDIIENEKNKNMFE